MTAVEQETETAGSLDRTFDLVGERSNQTQYYVVRSELATHSNKGVLKTTDVYREHLMVEPGDPSDGTNDRFTCTAFTVQRGDGPEQAIPSLAGFSYEVDKAVLDANGVDVQGRLYSVPEDAFDDLVDASGTALPFDVGYQVYSAFFYFHTYTEYAEPPASGAGIQDLHEVGDRVTGGKSYAEAPLPGKLAKEGSFWKYGEIMLSFEGLSTVAGRPCAVVGFNSGVCRWSMPMAYMPAMRLKTVGVSNYQGTFHLDLSSKWVRSLDLTLFENTSTTMWRIPVDKSIPVTTLAIRALDESEFPQA